jgi:hypothetical protein
MSSGGKRSWVRLVVLSVLPLCLAYACGGKTDSDADDDPDGKGGKQMGPDAGDAGSAGGGAGGADRDAGPDAALDAALDASDAEPADSGPDVYVDPGCPDAAPPPSTEECDVFSDPSGCPEGLGCYPYVEHPYGEGCDVQTFGSVCLPAGSAGQGEECASGATGCAPGYACVVGAQSGKRCVKMCDLDAPNTCGDGLICGETDVEGVGVCV